MKHYGKSCILLISLFLLPSLLFASRNAPAPVDQKHEQADSSNLKIALLQLSPQTDPALNLKKGTEYCRIAKKKGADIALFPELYNIGYHGVDFNQPDTIRKWKSMAVNEQSDYVKHFQQLARELDMAIVITYLEDTGENKLPKNSATLIDRHGNIVFTYSKVHTAVFTKMENELTPGTDFYVKDMDTRSGPVKIGVMICYDREFPESARILMLKGAEIILTPNACNLDKLRLCQFKTRAFENAVVTAMANYSSEKNSHHFNGHSVIYDAEGNKVIIAGKREGVFMGSINLHDLRQYRQKTIWGKAYRRPQTYKILISPEVEDIFKRKDSNRKDINRLK